MYIYYVFVKNQMFFLNEKFCRPTSEESPTCRHTYEECVRKPRRSDLVCHIASSHLGGVLLRPTSEDCVRKPRRSDLMCYDEFKDEEEDWKGLVEGGWVFGFSSFAGF